MLTLDIILRGLTLIILIIWRLYWTVTKLTADKNKPKTKHQPIRLEQLGLVFFGTIILLGLFNFTLFPLRSSLIQMVGFIILVVGFIISMSGRKTLADNWTESYNFQIKKKHELIQSGVYKFIRHPIYTGVYLTNLGAFMVIQTWLFIPVIGLIFYIDKMAKREEKLLIKFFGKAYLEYIRTSKRFFPYIY